jgi:hypothetical protein
MAIRDSAGASRAPDALDARVHQGYDPSSEFKDNSLVYSGVQYGADSNAPEDFFEKPTDDSESTARDSSDIDPKFYSMDEDGALNDADALPAPLDKNGSATGEDASFLEGGFGSSPATQAANLIGFVGSSGVPGDGGNNSVIGGGDVNIVTGTDDGDDGGGLLPPVIVANPVNGNESTPIPLNISVISPTAGSTVSILIGNIPAGATLSAGINNGNGTWTLTPAQLVGLTITPPPGFSGSINAGVTATSMLGSETEAASGNIPVTVNGVATPPDLDVLPASGNENTAIALDIDAALIDNDGSETLSITIYNVPTGAILSAGVNNGNGSWALTPGQLSGFAITPPNGYSGTINLTVTATSSENGTTASVSDPLAVTVNGVATPPNLLAPDVSGNENTPIPLNIAASLNDNDGSETLTITISGVPTDATLSAGTDLGGGVWQLTPVQLAGLTLTPPSGWNGDLILDVVATSSENGTTAFVSDEMTVTINGTAIVPDLTVQDVTGNEDTAISLNITTALGAGSSGSEILSIEIAGVPAGATLSAGTNLGSGVWELTPVQLAGLTITPAANSDADFNLTVRATSTDGGDTAVNTEILHVVVNGVPDAPNLSLSNASGNEGASIALSITSSLVDNDGSEILSIQISGVPSSAILSAGTNMGGGVWRLTPAQLSGLTITPNGNYAGTINLNVSAVATENSTTAQTSQGLSVTVSGVADAPVLTVQDASGEEGAPIPLSIGAVLTDNDGSETLSIQISGVPIGATLSAGMDNGGGVWTLTSAQLVGLTITPAAGSDADFTLTVTATSTEGATTATDVETLDVTVNGGADAPDLLVSGNVTGDEDTAIPLTISAALNDNDGSETLSIVITGFPAGSTFSAGLYAGNGKWSLSPADLAGLTITPPDDFSGTINLTVTAVATENEGDIETISDTITVTVDPVADDPTLSVQASIGNEDTSIALNISAALTDSSELLTVTISGVPAGAMLSAGTNMGGGVWSLTPAQLVGLTLTPASQSDADFVLSVTATSRESDNTTETETLNLNVTVNAVADIPTVSANGSTVLANNNASISVVGTLGADSSESLSYVIDGVPDGFALNQGYNNGDNSWTVTAAQLAGLQVIAPLDFEGTVNLRAYAVSHDNNNSTIRSVADDFAVIWGNPLTQEINLPLGLGNLGIGLGTGIGIGLNLGSLILEDFTVMEGSTVDLSDAPDLLSGVLGVISRLEFANVPSGVTFNHGTNVGGGVWEMTAADLNGLQMTLPEDDTTDFTLTYRAIVLDILPFLPPVTVVLATPDFTVIGVADEPSLSVGNVIGTEGDASLPLSITAALNDAAGEVLSIVIKDLPPGFVPNAGIDNGDGSWTIPLASVATLALIPPSNFSGNATFTVVAIATEAEGDSSIRTVTGNISITADADAPIIAATLNSGIEDQSELLSLGISLADTDGSESILSITISGLSSGGALLNATDNGNGTWSVAPANIGNVSFVPASGWSGDVSLLISVISVESSNGDQATNTGTIPIHIEAQADTPYLLANDVAGVWSAPIVLDISAALTDTDGSETMSVVISGMPMDFILSAGLNNGDGSWTLDGGELAGLQIEAPDDYSGGDITLDVTVYAVETGNQNAASVDQSFTVQGA